MTADNVAEPRAVDDQCRDCGYEPELKRTLGSLFYAEPGAGWGVRGGLPATRDPLTATCQNWVAGFSWALAPHVDGAYVDVPNAGASDWVTAYWGPNVERLRAIKTTYDPHNVFAFEQSIAPLQCPGPAVPSPRGSQPQAQSANR